MSNCFALPGIKTLAYVRASALTPSIAMKAVAKLPVSIYVSPTPIEFTGECTCVVDSTNEHNGTSEVAVLSFRSQADLPEEFPLAFVLTDVHGKTYVLGAYEPPFPKITVSKTFGLPQGDPRTKSYEVTFQSIKALIECSLA